MILPDVTKYLLYVASGVTCHDCVMCHDCVICARTLILKLLQFKNEC